MGQITTDWVFVGEVQSETKDTLISDQKNNKRNLPTESQITSDRGVGYPLLNVALTINDS